MVDRCVNLLQLLAESVLSQDHVEEHLKDLAEEARNYVKNHGSDVKSVGFLKLHYQNKCNQNQKVIMNIRSDIDRYMSEID